MITTTCLIFWMPELPFCAWAASGAPTPTPTVTATKAATPARLATRVGITRAILPTQTRESSSQHQSRAKSAGVPRTTSDGWWVMCARSRTPRRDSELAHVLPGHRDRSAPRRHGIVPDFEPGPLGAPAGMARLGQPGARPVSERVLLSRVPRRRARRNRLRPAGVLPAGLGPHHRRPL